MKLTIHQVYEAVDALTAISNRPRLIPAIAKYKLARMHDALEPTHREYEERRITLVQKHGCEQFNEETPPKSLGWGLRPNTPAFEAYVKEWEEATKATVEITITPITLLMLGNDPKGVEMAEFKQLGDLVVNNLPEDESTLP